MTKLYDLASTIRSKNAGVNQVTFDIIFPNAERYRKVLATNAITKVRTKENTETTAAATI